MRTGSEVGCRCSWRSFTDGGCLLAGVADESKSPDVNPDGSLQESETAEAVTPETSTPARWFQRGKSDLHAFLIRQRNALYLLLQLTGFAFIAVGVIRVFPIGVYGVDAIGPISLTALKTQYVPGPSVAGVDLGFLWLFIGVVIVFATTR